MTFPNDTKNGKELFLALFAEFLATLFFVYMGCLSVVASAETAATSPGSGGSDASVSRILPIAMSFGMSMMVLIYAVGNLSGGHINPAVSFFLCLIRQISPLRTVLYIVAQILGSLLGAALVLGSVSGLAFSREDVERTPYSLGANTLNDELTTGNGFLLECMGTLFLLLVVFMTAVRGGGPSDGQPNLAPLCIGFAVMITHLVLVPLTGCGINPARTIGPAIINSFAGNRDGWEKNAWIYYVAPMSAAVLAAGLYYLIDHTDDLPIDWDIFDGDDDDSESTKKTDQTGAGTANDTIDVRKYRKPSSVPTTGFSSSHTRKLKLVLKASTKIRGRPKIVPSSSSMNSNEGPEVDPTSHKFPVHTATKDVGKGTEQTEDPNSHKFPKFAAPSTENDSVSQPSYNLPAVQPPASRLGTPPVENSAANSHKFPPVKKAVIDASSSFDPEDGESGNTDAALSHKFPPKK